MARSRGFPQVRRSGSGVARTWDAGPGGVAVTAISATEDNILGAGITPVAGAGELTILRTRGILDFFIRGGATADGDGFFGAVGICIVSATAFGVGITAVPLPVTDISYPWMWHSFLSIHQQETGSGIAGWQGSHQRIMIDSKAMRKFNGEQVAVAVMEVTEIGGATASVFLDTRILAQDSGR